jgi:hypothetical protein
MCYVFAFDLMWAKGRVVWSSGKMTERDSKPIWSESDVSVLTGEDRREGCLMKFLMRI